MDEEKKEGDQQQEEVHNEATKQDFKYRVLVGNKDLQQIVIEKTGIVSTFTLGEILISIAEFKKKREEMEQQIAIEEARMFNINRDRPEIANMPEEERNIIFMYQRAFAMVKVAKPKLEEFDDALDEYFKDFEHIVEQTGIKVEGMEKLIPAKETDEDTQKDG